MNRRGLWIAVCAVIGAVLVFAGSFASAQDQNMNGNMRASGSGDRMMSVSSEDRKFMMMAAAGGMAEVEMGKLALERATSADVKTYAQKMIDDHTKANEELMGIAQAKGVALPAGPDEKHMKMLEKMRQLSGAEFDRQYVMMAGHKDHEKMEKLFRDETRKGRDAEVKAFAAKTLPVVQEHLRLARDMHTRMMGTNRSMSGNMNSNK
ncbi:MAG: DUF4142 domain-containing protein [Pyrinomonadaceae bacterium]